MEKKIYPFGINLCPTPWDGKALGLKTFDIQLENINESDEISVINTLDEITSSQGPALFCSRINANLISEKRVLYRTGFNNYETQLHVTNNNITNFSVPLELGKRRLKIDIAQDHDYAEITKKSLEVFRFSRFHEDPFVEKELADLRMQLWCEDMHKNKIPLLVYRNNKNELDSFVYYKLIDEHTVELVLGGSMPSKGMLTPLFWASFLEYFKDTGVKRIKTKISASNVSIVNIYTFFNFTIKATYFDFHKHILL